MNRDLALGYTAWIEMWEAKKYALSRLREVGNRLRAPELSIAFCSGADQWTEAEQLRRFDEAQKKELDLLGNKKVAEAELARVRAEYEEKLITAAMERTAALQRQRIELVGTEGARGRVGGASPGGADRACPAPDGAADHEPRHRIGLWCMEGSLSDGGSMQWGGCVTWATGCAPRSSPTHLRSGVTIGARRKS